MADEHPDQQHRRRTFLKSIGALGASSAIAPGAAAAQEGTQDSADDYHTTLRNELTASSRQQKQLPAGENVYGTTEQAALDAFSLQGAGTESTISVDTDAVPITAADRLEISADASEPYEATYRGAISGRTFSEGDLLLGVAYVRSDSADARATVQFKYQYTDSSGQTAYSESFVARGAEIGPEPTTLTLNVPARLQALSKT